jgi:PhnB protein
MKDYKPTGYNSLSPYIIVDGATRMAAFLTTVFDARPLRKYEGPDGKIVHAEMQVDDSVIMFADATKNWPANHPLLHLYVEDVDAVFQKAVDAGCEVIHEPRVQEGDPDRRATVKDFGGNYWSISTQQKKD